MNTCSTCQYFHESSCHRYPPVVVGYVESNSHTGNFGHKTYLEGIETYTRSEFPHVLPEEWCGEHKPKQLPVESK